MTHQSHSVIGQVIQTFNRFFLVELGDRTLLCQPKGNLRRHPDPDYHLPVIGDQVEIRMVTHITDGVEGQVANILERRNYLARSVGEGTAKKKIMAANMDRVFVVSAVKNPGLNWHLIDRYLVSCELLDLPVNVLINKIDLGPDQLHHPLLQTYRDLGYRVFETSATERIGGARLRAATATGISLFTGTSGVGKSSLINWLVPHAKLKVAEVSRQKGLGKHTTTSSVLIPLSSTGFLADSPGLRDFYPPPVPPNQVRFGYREIVEFQGACRYPSCLHQQEPGCAVRQSAQDGTINRHRYHSYLLLLQEMIKFADRRY